MIDVAREEKKVEFPVAPESAQSPGRNMSCSILKSERGRCRMAREEAVVQRAASIYTLQTPLMHALKGAWFHPVKRPTPNPCNSCGVTLKSDDSFICYFMCSNFIYFKQHVWQHRSSWHVPWGLTVHVTYICLSAAHKMFYHHGYIVQVSAKYMSRLAKLPSGLSYTILSFLIIWVITRSYLEQIMWFCHSISLSNREQPF